MSSTPTVARTTDNKRLRLNRSWSSRQPKTTMNAGVAAVMTDPICAEVSIVPDSWVTIDKVFPVRAESRSSFQSLRSIFHEIFCWYMRNTKGISATPYRIQTKATGVITPVVSRTAMNMAPQILPASDNSTEPISRLRNRFLLLCSSIITRCWYKVNPAHKNNRQVDQSI